MPHYSPRTAEPRETQITFRVSETEYHEIQTAMHRQGIYNWSFFIRQALEHFTGRIEHWRSIGITGQLRELVHELRRQLSPLKELRSIPSMFLKIS